MPKKLFRAFYAVNYVIQAGFCMVTPAALFIGLGWLLVNKLGFGRWAMVAAILLGVATGLSSLFRFLTAMAKTIDPTGGAADEGMDRRGADRADRGAD